LGSYVRLPPGVAGRVKIKNIFLFFNSFVNSDSNHEYPRMRNEPVIIIDDDIEDLELLKAMATELRVSSQVLVFNNPEDALDFLKKTIIEPLFILCDINMPRINGFQLRTELLKSDSTIKDVPFLFLSTAKTEYELSKADTLKVQAYYTKANSFNGMRDIFENIVSSLKIGPVQ
jgi:CheY-like chemotaxis protein